MKAKLHLPAILGVVVIAAAAAAAMTTTSCGDDGDPSPDAACGPYCMPVGGSGADNCPFPTCATGPNLDMCPADCAVGV